MICYAFPLAHEAELFLKGCTGKESFCIDNLSCTMGQLDGRTVLVALVGMGTERARQNTHTIFQYFRPKALILAGYGGALVPQLKVGQVLISNNYSSEEVQSFLRLLSGFDFASFSTVDEVIGTPVRREWQARKSQAQVVDMETAAVAEVAKARAISFTALRVISDDYQQVLPTGALAAGFDPVRGRATPFRLLGYLAIHPGEIKPFKNFVVGLSLARKNLTTFLRDLNNELPSKW